MALTYSFYAEVAAARGDIDEGRRRRLELLDFYLGLPDEPFVIAARAYSRAKLAGLDGDLEQSERYYREAADGFAQIDRPMMLAMCLGMVADFDERTRRLPSRDRRPGRGHRDQRRARAARLQRFAAGAARLGPAPRRRHGACRDRLQPRAGPRPPAEQHAGDLPCPRRSGRACTGSTVATLRRPRRRPRRSTCTWPASLAGWRTASIRAPTCSPVPRCVARCSASSPSSAVTPSRRHDCSGTPTASAAMPGCRCRRSSATTSIGPPRRRRQLLGPDAFQAAFELGRHGQLGQSVAFKP